MKIIYRICIILIIIIISFAFVGCGVLFPNYRQNNVVTIKDHHGTIYIFYEKVKLEMNDPDFSKDRLTIVREGDTTEYSRILSGRFERFAYEEGEIIILMDDNYYTFEVDEYVPQKQIEYMHGIKMYSSSDFQNNYPDNQDFEWKKHDE